MDESDSSQQRRERLLKEIADLEKRLASLKASLPVHSLSPAMFAQIDDLEYEIKQKKAALERDKAQPDSQPSN